MLHNFVCAARSSAASPRAVLIGFVVAALALGASPIGSLAPHGEVRLGDAASPIAASRPLTRGDAIETGAESLASIRTWNDGRLEVRSESRARLFEDRLILERGAAASEGLPIRLDDLTVAPAGAGQHWFAVGRRDGRTIVAAHKGSVVIRRSGSRSIVVPAGSYALPSPKGAKDDTKDEDDERRAAGASGRTAHPPASTGQGGWTVGSLSHGQSMLLVGGVAAVAATGVVAGVVITGDDEQPARSPSQQ